MNALLADMTRELEALEGSPTQKAALDAVGLLKGATQSLLEALSSRLDAAMAVSVPYLMLCGYTMGGWLLAKSSANAAKNLQGPDKAFYQSKIHTARFYADQVLPNALALARVVQSGAESVIDTDATLI
jgi:butyryl-CoA dehydrogenase